MAALIIFLGAGLGGALRHGVNVGCARLCGVAFPWGTLVVNVSGCFAMGAIVGWLAVRGGEGWSQSLRLFLTTGVLGGFTTFSAFSLDALLLVERGALASAAAYVVGSVGASLAAVSAGLALVRSLA